MKTKTPHQQKDQTFLCFFFCELFFLGGCGEKMRYVVRENGSEGGCVSSVKTLGGLSFFFSLLCESFSSLMGRPSLTHSIVDLFFHHKTKISVPFSMVVLCCAVLSSDLLMQER